MSADERACSGCFIACRPNEMVGNRLGREYPCTNALRKWAGAHRNDPGDELGFVWEQREGEGRRS